MLNHLHPAKQQYKGKHHQHVIRNLKKIFITVVGGKKGLKDSAHFKLPQTFSGSKSTDNNNTLTSISCFIFNQFIKATFWEENVTVALLF